MFGAIVFTYGMLTSFVLTSASRNKKMSRANPRVVEYTGYVLCGCSIAISALLLAQAVLGDGNAIMGATVG